MMQRGQVHCMHMWMHYEPVGEDQEKLPTGVYFRLVKHCLRHWLVPVPLSMEQQLELFDPLSLGVNQDLHVTHHMLFRHRRMRVTDQCLFTHEMFRLIRCDYYLPPRTFTCYMSSV